MVGYSMSNILLMVTMVVLSWRFLTRGRQDIRILSTILLLFTVVMDMEELEVELVEELEEGFVHKESLDKLMNTEPNLNYINIYQ